MKTSNCAILSLLLSVSCVQGNPASLRRSAAVRPAKISLGTIAASEVAAWKELGASTLPNPRYLQAAAFDSTRNVAVIFGGVNPDSSTGAATANQETWEWSPATGKWTNRTLAGTAPSARSGAVMVYDSKRAKMVLFGGRSGSGYDYQDTWEWDPTTGTWTDETGGGSSPPARAQGGMAYETSTGKILLFGGGRSDPTSSDATGMTASLGDTWQLDPTTYTWTALTPATTPTSRYGLGLVWDSSRNKAVLFGGMAVDVVGATGVPMQDTWDWDPSAATWTERTVQGAMPSPRYAHAMAFDGSHTKVLIFGGFDISTGGNLNDVWQWDPTSGAYTELLTGSQAVTPSPRKYASMVSDDTLGRLEVIAGEVTNTSNTYPILPLMMSSSTGMRDVWELDPTTPAFTNRSSALDVPSARTGHCMAYYPPSAATYVFGGTDETTGLSLNDFWSWNGISWSQVTSSVSPPALAGAALAFDPTRKSLILYGGSVNGTPSSATWEWTPSTGWAPLAPTTNPGALIGHGMVTDTIRNKILLFGGYVTTSVDGGATYVVGGSGPYLGGYSTMPSDVWEWDGAALTWTDRTLTTAGNVPTGRQDPVMAYDSGQQKLFLYDGTGAGTVPYWQWDPISAGWAFFNTGDNILNGYASMAVYDSIRSRVVLLAQASDTDSGTYYAYQGQTWEIDTGSNTLYVRSPNPSPGIRYNSAMAFDSGRDVVVLFSGSSSSANGAMSTTDDTWEYTVTGLGNGEGCTAAFAASCASGYCVDGVCCGSSTCSGPCKACNVAGSLGTCVAAKAGTTVAGSCADGQACDGTGNCLASNGTACTSAAACASGACVDGVCCNSACTGQCMACDQPGLLGICSPYPAGTDPRNECGIGSGVCKSACNGVNGCGFPQSNVSCGTCMSCDGNGSCSSAVSPFCGCLTPFCIGTGTIIGTGTGTIIGTGTSIIIGTSPFATGGDIIPPPFASGGAIGSAGTYGSGGAPGDGAAGSASSSSTALGGSAIDAPGTSSTGLGGSAGLDAPAIGVDAPGHAGGGAIGYDGNPLGSGGATGQANAEPGDSGPATGVDGAAAAQARLHSGCSCALGSSTRRNAPSSGLALALLTLGLLWTRSRRPGGKTTRRTDLRSRD